MNKNNPVVVTNESYRDHFGHDCYLQGRYSSGVGLRGQTIWSYRIANDEGWEVTMFADDFRILTAEELTPGGLPTTPCVLNGNPCPDKQSAETCANRELCVQQVAKNQRIIDRGALVHRHMAGVIREAAAAMPTGNPIVTGKKTPPAKKAPSKPRTKPYTEKQAIAILEDLGKHWPKTIGLFSWSGSLHVIRMQDNGRWPEDGTYNDNSIAWIGGITNDGGDPN